MGHRWDCPTDWEARLEGYRSEEERRYERNPYKSSYGDGGCEDAAKQWERGKRDAEYDMERQEQERLEAERTERRRQEERHMEELREEEYHRDMEERHQEEEAEQEPDPEPGNEELPF